MAKSNEPVLWLLFSAGGMISAMVFPMLLIITGAILPFELAGEVNFERIHNDVKNPVVKLILFFVIALPFFHWAHRFRFTLIDIGLKPMRFLIYILCYGDDITGTIVTAFILWRI